MTHDAAVMQFLMGIGVSDSLAGCRWPFAADNSWRLTVLQYIMRLIGIDTIGYVVTSSARDCKPEAVNAIRC